MQKNPCQFPFRSMLHPGVDHQIGAHGGALSPESCLSDFLETPHTERQTPSFTRWVRLFPCHCSFPLPMREKLERFQRLLYKSRLKSWPESGLDCLICARFALQRCEAFSSFSLSLNSQA